MKVDDVMQHGIKVGDLVKMKRGYSAPGLVLGINETIPATAVWATVLWADHGKSLEKVRDLVVISASKH